MNKVVLVIVILIILLRKNENFGERFSLMDITSFPINVGKDIDITLWDGVNNSGSSGGLGDTGKTNNDAQMAPSSEWNLQWGDVNRRCWSDTTNSGKIIGFRKELKAGGGGKLWYLYSSDGKMPTDTQAQTKNAKIIASVGNFNIPQYLICLKSRKIPTNPDCSWIEISHVCVGSSPTACNGYGTWNDVYSVTAGRSNGVCFDAYGNALTNATNASVPVTGGKCTLPLCSTGFDDGVPGTITGTQVSMTKFTGKTTIADCLKACNTTIGCKYFQFNAGSPNSCTGWQIGATVSPSSAATVTSWVYTRA